MVNSVKNYGLLLIEMIGLFEPDVARFLNVVRLLLAFEWVLFESEEAEELPETIGHTESLCMGMAGRPGREDRHQPFGFGIEINAAASRSSPHCKPPRDLTMPHHADSDTQNKI